LIKKVIIVCFGLACAAIASQAPEFTQQYLQRLGGWVDSYKDRVARLDLRAAQFKMTRTEYLEALQASADPKVRQEAANIATWPIYLKQYTEMQVSLQTGAALMQPIKLLQNYFDPAFKPIVQATFAEYKAAAPITGEGAIFGGIGFIVGWILTGFGGALLRAPLEIIRRRRAARKNLPKFVNHKLDEPTLSANIPETGDPEEPTETIKV